MVTPTPSATLSKPKKAAKSVKSKAPAAPVAKEAKRQRAAPLSADAPVKKKKKARAKLTDMSQLDDDLLMGYRPNLAARYKGRGGGGGGG